MLFDATSPFGAATLTLMTPSQQRPFYTNLKPSVLDS